MGRLMVAVCLSLSMLLFTSPTIAAESGDSALSREQSGPSLASFFWEGVSTMDLLRAAADRASWHLGRGRGGHYGLSFHAQFRKEIRSLGLANLTTTVSYRDGQLVPYGSDGSVRVDVVEGDPRQPYAAYLLLLGSSTLSPQRANELHHHLPGGTKVIQIPYEF